MSVARTAAAESPNPAPMGSRHSVVTRAATPSRSRAYSTGGDPAATRPRQTTRTLVAAAGVTVERTPSSMTTPAPTLPVLPGPLPSTRLK